jgi:hypothetical protein
MRKRIVYEKTETKGYILRAEITGCKKVEQLRTEVEELLGLEFEIRDIDDGGITAFKPATSPLDIFDPRYASYRCAERVCEDE